MTMLKVQRNDRRRALHLLEQQQQQPIDGLAEGNGSSEGKDSPDPTDGYLGGDHRGGDADESGSDSTPVGAIRSHNSPFVMPLVSTGLFLLLAYHVEAKENSSASSEEEESFLQREKKEEWLFGLSFVDFVAFAVGFNIFFLFALEVLQFLVEGSGSKCNYTIELSWIGCLYLVSYMQMENKTDWFPPLPGSVTSPK